MRYLLLFVFILGAGSAGAQIVPATFINNNYRGAALSSIPSDSSKKKWSVSKYSGINTSFSFFKGGNAMAISAPLGLQLNRLIRPNLYAFAGVSFMPSYINFNGSYPNAGFGKSGSNTFNRTMFGASSRAELGLMYINDEKTFSISGSVGIEHHYYPFPAVNSNVNNEGTFRPIYR